MMYRFEEKRLGDGATEIGVRHEETNALVGVITHPCPGAKWFVHFMDSWNKEKYSSKKAAMERFKLLTDSV